MEPDRWLRLRHPEGFSAEMFDCFRSGCTLWLAYVQVRMRERERLQINEGAPQYTAFAPELSADGLVASLPLAGRSTLGSRARYENFASYLLREFFPFDFSQRLEEGLTEDVGDGRGYQTSWRSPARLLMSSASGRETCPRCGDASAIHPKLVLIDETWVDEPGKDPRLRYFADLRVDAVRPEALRPRPLEQFIDGYFCARCDQAFVSDETLEAYRRRHR
jgi:hypothetical protein